MQLLGKMLGDPNKKELNTIQPLIDKINAFEPTVKKLSDEELNCTPPSPSNATSSRGGVTRSTR